ncbi:hypothetical protein K505DRAFT_400437 [Melanomma pulvis-pyrius CBS 109.77]|uniref:Uncharacterized protein n=1 Tax=Melanomma pulvis-pyrius CBS 109.77 TaxID=1314802 RepID=A0A6A6WPF9_9PLEO|nr:hypothetical protein K505DRAFT_400437 [Melanomma pulvis-pyrius CBS 109.77]
MSSFKKLAVRTKKSLSGLYSFSNDQSPTKENADKSPTDTNPSSSDAAGLEEFGARTVSPGKESPSRRKRLLGSLRSIGSMRSSKSGHFKPSDEPLVQAETPPKRERPSLALNFDSSPFDPELPDSILNPPGLSAFTIGSVPDSPAPVQKMLNYETMLRHLTGEAAPTRPIFSPWTDDPLPTPMPGTNLPMDVDEDSIITKDQCKQQGYFNIPRAPDQKNSDSTNSVAVTDSSIAHDHGSVTATDATDETEVDAIQLSTSRTSPKLKLANSKEALVLEVDSQHFALDVESRKSWKEKKAMILAYLALDDTDSIEEKKGCLERRQSTWGRHSGLYDGAGYGDSETARNTPQSTSDIFDDDDDDAFDVIQRVFFEDNPENTNTNTEDVHAYPNGSSSPSPEESQSPVNEREALQEIIRAYAAPSYEDEAKEAQASGFVGRLSEEEVEAYGEEITVNTKEDVVESIRMMNRSLGG